MLDVLVMIAMGMLFGTWCGRLSKHMDLENKNDDLIAQIAKDKERISELERELRGHKDKWSGFQKRCQKDNQSRTSTKEDKRCNTIHISELPNGYTSAICIECENSFVRKETPITSPRDVVCPNCKKPIKEM